MELQPQLSKETLSFKSTSEGDLHLDLHRTPRMTEGCVAFLHGGALLLGDKSDLPKTVISLLHENGLDVASLNYRLSPTTTVDEIGKDITDGCSFLRERYPNMPLLVIGYSAGAYLALQGGANGAPIDGLCAFGGYGDLGASWYTDRSQFFIEYKNVDYVADKIAAGEVFETTDERIDLYVYLRQHGLWPGYVLGESAHELAETLSPINHLTSSFPRTILIHGEQDMDVPVSASREMATALEAANIPHRLFVLENLGHDLFAETERPEVLAVWNEALRFLRQK